MDTKKSSSSSSDYSSIESNESNKSKKAKKAKKTKKTKPSSKTKSNKEKNLKTVEKKNPEFYLWLNTPYSGNNYGKTQYRDTTINKFIKSIFSLLYNGKVCFSSGTLVFNDNYKCLFNLLTYNQITMDSSIYSCNNPLNYINNRRNKTIGSKNVHYQTNHKTHNNVFKQNKGKPVACIPNPNSHTKFERTFNPPLTELCEIKKSEKKGVLLYYPFTASNSNKRLLFFKLERDKMISIGHVKKATATYIGNPIDKAIGTKIGVKEKPEMGVDLETDLDLRREDRTETKYPKECKYETYFFQKDILFYKNYYYILNQDFEQEYIDNKFEEDFEELSWYNENVRTGCEFYVTKNLLFTMFEFLLAPTKTLTLNKLEYGGNGLVKTW
jgi:hypothetical protein